MGNKGELVVSLRDQPRQEGSRKEHTLTWVAPSGWGTEVLNLPEGTTVPLELAITSLEDGVLVELHAETKLVGQCVRCLEPVTVPVELNATEVYSEAPSKNRRRRADSTNPDIEVTGDEFDEECLIDKDTIDLEPLLRDEIFADAPLRPVCSPDCLGLCEHCGKLLKDLEPGHKHEFIDPRFAALAALLESQDDEGDEPPSNSKEPAEEADSKTEQITGDNG